jgi:error-prone DNA polymerase
MTRNGILGETQEQIIQSITSFALYGFPESHAASFALIAYASAYLKCHYLAAFTAALLNNQPMGFYHPATIVKDAQRHGLKMLAMDVTRSDWKCTLELSAVSSQPSVRLGLKYARGLREPAGQALVRERSLAPFISIQDLARRVPELRKDELTTLAEIGALNEIGNLPRRHRDTEKIFLEESPVEISWKKTAQGKSDAVEGSSSVPPCLRGEKLFHRRDALWQVERAVRWSGPLLDELPEDELPEIAAGSPLAAMTDEERLVADFRATGMTVGPHPMQYRRAEMKKMGIIRACDLAHLPNGRRLRIGGCVIARQRPGTAKGMMFMSLEDETGIANAIFSPDLLQKNRVLLISERFVMIEGILQNQDNVIHIRAEKISPLRVTKAETVSHDFH